MNPYYDADGVTIFRGDCREVLPTLSLLDLLNPVDAVITDPPYGLSFMGKEWDHGVPGVAFWTEILRTAKPGTHLLAFGGTRTFHRLACAIEDAGWDIRDTVMWVYGTGFPKSHNLTGDWEGWGTALKPAWEPIIVARKPLIGTVADNVQAHGVGALNVEGCRVGTYGGTQKVRSAEKCRTDSVGGYLNAKAGQPINAGRWPANLIHDGSEEVVSLFPDVGLSSGGTKSCRIGTGRVYDKPFNVHPGPNNGGLGDSGSAARFFYCAKASKKDRGEGNTHPTVKPRALMEYLCRLVAPPGATIFDPFMGSGSTLVAARALRYKAVGIDLDAAHCEIAVNRLRQP